MSAFSFITSDIEALPVPAEPPLLARRVPMGWLVGTLVGWLALDMLLLWQFLGLAQLWLTFGGIALSALLVREAAKAGDGAEGPTLATLLLCIAIAGLVLAIGGEGRFFYANPDWELRDALLRDMSLHRWPFVYATPDGIELLRAPIAMYLLPALGAKLWGQAGGDLLLLGQNAILVGLLFALGSTLFASVRARWIALGCFLGFSGLDILGQLLRGHAPLLTATAHLEPWSVTQYSSTITLFFWVPQHAFAGWCGALAVLLWRTGRLQPAVPLAMFPLLLLWSPLAGIGLVPFMAWIGIDSLCRRRVTLRAIGTVAGALLLAIPALLYLKAGGDAVGARIFSMRPADYLLFEAFEVMPFLLAAAVGWKGRFGGMLFALVAFCLFSIPFGQLGSSIDFAMRASIPALAILSVQLAETLSARETGSARRSLLIAALALGSVTGLAEIARGLSFPISPVPRCPLTSQWLKYKDFTAASATYTARLSALPPIIRPVPRVIVPLEPGCRDQPWPWPMFFH